MQTENFAGAYCRDRTKISSKVCAVRILGVYYSDSIPFHLSNIVIVVPYVHSQNIIRVRTRIQGRYVYIRLTHNGPTMNIVVHTCGVAAGVIHCTSLLICRLKSFLRAQLCHSASARHRHRRHIGPFFTGCRVESKLMTGGSCAYQCLW